MPQSTFFVLFVVTAIAAVWMHWTIHQMLHRASPELAGKIDDHSVVAGPAEQSPAEPVLAGATTAREGTTERTDG
jgi:NNP family nitrate/nitrite transporter-like MFS transporter